VGGQFLSRTLSRIGRPDLALVIATQRDYPSLGYMAEQGATTVWELWNGDTADPAMNSGNHVMLTGDLLEWMYADLAGIAPADDGTGFRTIRMEPRFVPGLDFVEATYDSPYGRIESHWRRTDGGIRWDVTVPANATAVAVRPGRPPRRLESGHHVLAP
jgi:alpha-L-rhamnosidase